MATRSDLEREVREITQPARMSLRQALAVHDPTTALHTFVSNVPETTQIGSDLSRDYYAMCAINSGGVPALFLTEWLYERLPDIRTTLASIGAHRTLSVLDAISERIGVSPAAKEDPGVVILSSDFNTWEKYLSHADELADEVRDCLLAYLRKNVEEFERAQPEPGRVMALQAEASELQEIAERANAWSHAAAQADAQEFEQLMVRMVRRGQRIEAVRAWRGRYRCGMTEASAAVARLSGGIETPQTGAEQPHPGDAKQRRP